MTLMDTIREISNLRREVDNQRRLIDDFLRANQQNISMVRTELQGSRSGADQKMLSSLKVSEDALRKAAAGLGSASDALARVETI